MNDVDNKEREIAIYSGTFLKALGHFVNAVAAEAHTFNEETQASKITEVTFTISNRGYADEVFTVEVHPETGEGGVLLDR